MRDWPCGASYGTEWSPGHKEAVSCTADKCCPALLLVLVSSFGLELGLEAKGATFFLFRKVTCIIHIALICREISLHKLGFTALPGSVSVVELLQFNS